MPTYDYLCEGCQNTFETQHAMAYQGPVPCPACGSDHTHKVISAPVSVLDWKLSESVHTSKRFRPRTLNRALSRTGGNHASAS